MKVFVNQSTKTVVQKKETHSMKNIRRRIAPFEILILPPGLRYCTGGIKQYGKIRAATISMLISAGR